MISINCTASAKLNICKLPVDLMLICSSILRKFTFKKFINNKQKVCEVYLYLNFYHGKYYNFVKFMTHVFFKVKQNKES